MRSTPIWQSTIDSADVGGEQDYWLSYSDLLAGLLMVFALMLLVALDHYQSQAEDVRDLLEARQALVGELQTALAEQPDLNVTVDSVTGVVTFAGDLLFEENSHTILLSGEQQLGRFAVTYLNVLFGEEEFRNQLDEVVVEGHTNTNGTYLYNLSLSQDRALNVMEILLRNAGPAGEELRQYVTANGRSFSRPVYTSEGEIDMVRSRRIEIRFRLKDEEVIREVMDRLFLTAGP